MQRYDRLREILRLDPDKDFLAIYRLTATYEFPWDFTRALELALFRTYAVPAIGGLLADTAEFTDRTQKRYDDTALLLDAIVEHGFESDTARTAIRRVNQMHRSYDISNEDMRYVLSTFVVIPARWLDAYGWRPLTHHERRASANYYATLGRHLGITDIPGSFEEFESTLNAYEEAHFGWDEGARQVADSTLDLMASWYPAPLAPRSAARASPCSTSRCWTPSGSPAHTPGSSGLSRAPCGCAGARYGCCPRARPRTTPARTRRSRATPVATTWASSARFPCPEPAAAPFRIPAGRPEQRLSLRRDPGYLRASRARGRRTRRVSPVPYGQHQEAGVLVGVRGHLPARTGEQRAEVVLGPQVLRSQFPAVAGGEGRSPDRVKECEPAAGADHPGQLAQVRGRVGQVRDQPGGEHRVQRPVAQRQPGHVREQQCALRGPPRPLRGGQHLRGEVGPEHDAGGPDGGAQRVRARPVPQPASSTRSPGRSPNSATAVAKAGASSGNLRSQSAARAPKNSCTCVWSSLMCP